MIRAYDLVSENISTAVGTGVQGCGSDGLLASDSLLDHPDGLAYDYQSGTLFFSEPACHRVRSYSIASGTVTTVAGTGIAGSPVDGLLGTAAKLGAPRGLCLDSTPDLYITGRSWVSNLL